MNLKNFTKCGLVFMLVVSLITCQSINSIYALASDSSINVINKLEGDGLEDSPYLITSLEDYNELADAVIAGDSFAGKTIKLTADIGSQENPVTKALGTYTNAFGGNLDGDGHTIYLNLTDDRGLINKLAQNATIKNVIVDGSVTFSGSDKYVGGIAGIANPNCIIENCINKATINSTGVSGGIVGYIYNSTLTNNVNYGNVTGVVAYSTVTTAGNGVGGIVGTIDAANPSSIINCSNFGTVTSNNQAGGIVGKARTNAETTISNCINNGTITVTDNTSNNGVVGGIVGMAGCYINNCLNKGNVNGTSQVGGIVGALISGARVDACRNAGQVSGSLNYVGGIVGWAYKAVTANSITNCIQQRDGVIKADTIPTTLVGTTSKSLGWITGVNSTASATTVSGDSACDKVDVLGSGSENEP